MLGKLFGRKATEVRQAAAKLENRDLMQAIVYGAIYVAAADGDLEPAELDKVELVLQNTPQLQGYGAELSNLMDRAKTDFKVGARVLRQNAEKELSDLANSPQDAATVLNIMLTVAEADGDIEPAELEALERAAKRLGLNLKDYL